MSGNFWDDHGIIYLVSMMFFPRLTMLATWLIPHPMGEAFPVVWLGWIIAPRIIVAAGATVLYVQQNPLLVALVWIWALTCEFAEKKIFMRWGDQVDPNAR